MKKSIFVLAVMIMGVGCAKQDDTEATTPVAVAPEVEEMAASDGPDAYYAVSYTHLTLPTKLTV